MDDPSKFALTPTMSHLQEEQHLKCPRCNSNNTKFCYYNNYNLSQPRHFCKDCRRYWTRGGALRNVPVGGGTRPKHSPTLKRSSTTSSSPSSTAQPSKNDSSASSSFDQNRRMIDANESLISVLASNKLQFENLMEDLNRRV